MSRDTAYVLISAGIFLLAYALPLWVWLMLCAAVVIGFRLFIWFAER